MNKTISDAIALFSPTFGLRGHDGVFRISTTDSFISDSGAVMLYTERKTEAGTWQAFAKGTVRELTREIIEIPQVTERVYLVRESAMSGRGGFPSIGYRAVLHDAVTRAEVAKTKSVDGVLGNGKGWFDAGNKLAKRRGWIVVAAPIACGNCGAVCVVKDPAYGAVCPHCEVRTSGPIDLGVLDAIATMPSKGGK